MIESDEAVRARNRLYFWAYQDCPDEPQLAERVVGVSDGAAILLRQMLEQNDGSLLPPGRPLSDWYELVDGAVAADTALGESRRTS